MLRESIKAWARVILTRIFIHRENVATSPTRHWRDFCYFIVICETVTFTTCFKLSFFDKWCYMGMALYMMPVRSCGAAVGTQYMLTYRPYIFENHFCVSLMGNISAFPDTVYITTWSCQSLVITRLHQYCTKHTILFQMYYSVKLPSTAAVARSNWHQVRLCGECMQPVFVGGVGGGRGASALFSTRASKHAAKAHQHLCREACVKRPEFHRRF